MISSVRDRAPFAIALLISLAAGFVIASPSPRLLLFLALVGVVTLSLALPASTFLAASLLVFGTFQTSLDHPIHVGGLTVYSSDLLLLFVVLRALLPRAREAAAPGFLPVTKIILLLAAVVMLWGLWHGHAQGESIASGARIGVAGFYYPILFVSFSRVFRETAFVLHRFLLESAVVVVGFIGYMFAMKMFGHPFEQVNELGGAVLSNGGLGGVVLSNGAVLSRNFGYTTSFALFGLLSVFAVSFLRSRTTGARFPQVLVVLGVLATLATLIRGLIFGLILGLSLALFLSVRTSKRPRLKTAIQIGALLAVPVSFLAFVSPALRQGVTQRLLPGVVGQSTAAQANATERFEAFRVGLSAADARPMGSGFVSPAAVAAEGVDPTYLHDSSPAWLLVYLGWPGMLLAAAVLLAIVAESRRLPADEAWLQAAFVGSIAMLAAYSFSAPALVDQEWVVGPAALIIALRFGRPPASRTQHPISDAAPHTEVAL